MTYYKILQYCKKHGFTNGQAHYVRNMIRELVSDKGGEVLPRTASCSCGRRSCKGGCYEY
jgi:hypothetical protein